MNLICFLKPCSQTFFFIIIGICDFTSFSGLLKFVFFGLFLFGVCRGTENLSSNLLICEKPYEQTDLSERVGVCPVVCKSRGLEGSCSSIQMNGGIM